MKMEEKYFIIEYNEQDDYKGGVFKTKQGKEFARGKIYCLGDNNPKYLSVQGDDGLWTLYDRNGYPLKKARDAKHIYWNQKGYTVWLDNGKKTYIFPEYGIRQVLHGLGMIGMLGGLALSGYRGYTKGAAYEQKTQMTYLGISNGIAVFDTDGNKQTVEIVSDTLLNHQVGRLYGHEGQTHSIAQWKKISQIDVFEKIR